MTSVLFFGKLVAMVITTLQFKILSIVSIVLIASLAGWYPFQQAKREQVHAYDFSMGEALTSGIFLGAALLHMLPVADRLFVALQCHYPWAYSLAGGMFLLLLWLEHWGDDIYHRRGASSQHFLLLSWLILSLHSFLAGAVLGLNQQLRLGGFILFAMLVHKWGASFTLSLHLNKSSCSRTSKWLFFLSFVWMAPLGLVLSHTLNIYGIYAHYLGATFHALAAGTFLYLGTLHGLSRAVMISRCCDLKHFSFVILGFSVMAWVVIYA